MGSDFSWPGSKSLSNIHVGDLNVISGYVDSCW